MIVDAFIDTLEIGLKEDGQAVVSVHFLGSIGYLDLLMY